MHMSRHSHNKYSIIRKKYTDPEFGNYAMVFCCNNVAQKQIIYKHSFLNK